ncbi:MAG: DUF503 domain-containing protein [Syntrophales bacterium]|nr:DUF503 domain-containing protein [Syntrophales bacterium]
MVVGSGIIALRIPAVRSLKEKRGVLKKIIKRTQNEFNISIAEVGDQDTWGTSRIGFSLVGNDRRLIDAKADHVLRFIEAMNLAEIVDSRLEIVNISTVMSIPAEGMMKYGSGGSGGGDDAYDDL